MKDRTGLWTILGTVAVLSVATIAAGCTSDDTEQNRPTRIVCVEGGRIVLDDFVELGGLVTVGGAYISYTSETQKGTVYGMGNCVSRPQVKPQGWKPVFPG